MGARLVHQLSDCGLTVRAEGSALIVEPRNLITDPLRQFIREHKAEIVAELLAGNDHEQKLEPVLCIACQHYRFGYDHMGNVARCHAAGGFRGRLIERPEQRRECGDYLLYESTAQL
jgi:hypothetical protein